MKMSIVPGRPFQIFLIWLLVLRKHRSCRMLPTSSLFSRPETLCKRRTRARKTKIVETNRAERHLFRVHLYSDRALSTVIYQFIFGKRAWKQFPAICFSRGWTVLTVCLRSHQSGAYITKEDLKVSDTAPVISSRLILLPGSHLNTRIECEKFNIKN